MTDPDAVEALRPGEQGVDAFALGLTERAPEELGRDHEGRLGRRVGGRHHHGAVEHRART